LHPSVYPSRGWFVCNRHTTTGQSDHSVSYCFKGNTLRLSFAVRVSVAFRNTAPHLKPYPPIELHTFGGSTRDRPERPNLLPTLPGPFGHPRGTVSTLQNNTIWTKSDYNSGNFNLKKRILTSHQAPLSIPRYAAPRSRGTGRKALRLRSLASVLGKHPIMGEHAVELAGFGCGKKRKMNRGVAGLAKKDSRDGFLPC
jgi:hypothetical protein